MNEATLSGGDTKPVALVVEDEPILRALSVAVVEVAGFDAVEATSADEAIRVLEARIDVRVVFADVRMPGSIDGIILARTICRRWPPIHLILTSGAEDIGTRAIPRQALFFAKPYRTAEVIESLRQIAP